MTAAAGRAPIGVIGVQFTDTCIDTIFVNDEAGRLFGYSPSEIKRLILDPRENFFLRVWHFDDWRRMFTMAFSALVQQVEQTATKGRFFHSSGASLFSFPFCFRSFLLLFRYSHMFLSLFVVVSRHPLRSCMERSVHIQRRGHADIRGDLHQRPINPCTISVPSHAAAAASSTLRFNSRHQRRGCQHQQRALA